MTLQRLFSFYLSNFKPQFSELAYKIKTEFLVKFYMLLPLTQWKTANWLQFWLINNWPTMRHRLTYVWDFMNYIYTGKCKRFLSLAKMYLLFTKRCTPKTHSLIILCHITTLALDPKTSNTKVHYWTLSQASSIFFTSSNLNHKDKAKANLCLTFIHNLYWLCTATYMQTSWPCVGLAYC